MDAMFDAVREFLFGSLEINKEVLKAYFYDAGLNWVWDFTRDYLLNFRLWLLAAAALALERYKPVFRYSGIINKNLVFDGLYPIFTLPIRVFVIAGMVIGISGFYETYIPFANTEILDGQPLWVQAIGIFLITDLMFYVSHRISHEVPWLWHFHAIHHSQRDLNPFTTNREHPGEKIFKTIIRTIPIGFIGGEPSTWVVYLTLNSFWGYFIHSNIKMNLGALKYILVTPQYHRVHHSIERQHFDKNYGERLVIWDFLFGTLHRNFSDYPETGVKNTEWIIEKSGKPSELIRAWCAQMIYPFYMIGKSVMDFLKGRQKQFRRARSHDNG